MKILIIILSIALSAGGCHETKQKTITITGGQSPDTGIHVQVEDSTAVLYNISGPAEPIQDTVKIFLIGFSGWNKDGRLATGIMEQKWSIYPKINGAKKQAADYAKIPAEGLTILSIIEITPEQSKQFWK